MKFHLLAASVILACPMLFSTNLLAQGGGPLVTKVEANRQDGHFLGLKVFLRNGLILEGNDQSREVAVTFPDKQRHVIRNAKMYADDSAVILVTASGGLRREQYISRVIGHSSPPRGSHIGWFFQDNNGHGVRDELELYENDTVDGSTPLGGSAAQPNYAKDLPDGTIRTQQNQIAVPIVPKAWILNPDPKPALQYKPPQVSVKVNPSLEQLGNFNPQ